MASVPLSLVLVLVPALGSESVQRLVLVLGLPLGWVSVQRSAKVSVKVSVLQLELRSCTRRILRMLPSRIFYPLGHYRKIRGMSQQPPHLHMLRSCCKLFLLHFSSHGVGILSQKS